MNPNEPLIQPTASEPINSTPPAEPVPPVAQSMEFVPPPPENPVAMEQPIQMPPYAPAQPPVSIESPTPEPTNPVMQTTETTSPTPMHHKTDVLGILSIVSILFGILPVGLILGLVGASHAKKSHTSPIVSRVGWILNLVIMLIAIPVFLFYLSNMYQAAETKARDTERASDLGVIETKLESFFETNFGYPNNLDDIGITETKNLKGPGGTTIKINEIATDEEAAKATTNPSVKQEYIYTPYGKPACLTTCDGYVLKGYIESPTKGVTNPLIKFGLENL